MDGTLVLGNRPWNQAFGIGVVVGDGRERNTYKVAWLMGKGIHKSVEHRESFFEISGGTGDGETYKTT